MLDVKAILDDPKPLEESLRARGATELLADIAILRTLDDQRRKTIGEVEALKRTRNEASDEIAKLKKSKQDATSKISEMKEVSEKIKILDPQIAEFDRDIANKLSYFPNIIESSVPVGTSEADNRVERTWGDLPHFKFPPKSHYEMGESLGLMDFKRAGEVTGARFVFLKGLGARLERALISFMLDTHGEAGYEELLPPFLVNRKSMYGTGQLPKFEPDVFAVKDSDFFLIPTAEVPVTNYYGGEILDEITLPIQFAAFSPCFRAEAGSYGKDTKGLKRQHQFQKVELVKFVAPQHSTEALELLCKDAERILQKLGLPYRVVTLCSIDIGFGSKKTYDIEVWSPFEGKYVEISSCSNFGDFQSRRANIRYRSNADKKVHFVHTLNGSALAVGRTLLAIIENFQTASGDFTIPDCLKKYLD